MFKRWEFIVNVKVSFSDNLYSCFSVVINAGVAGCCTGLALSFPGISEHFPLYAYEFCTLGSLELSVTYDVYVFQVPLRLYFKAA